MNNKRLWAWLVGIALLLGAGIGFYQWEGQILTDYQYTGIVQDKWHTLDCSPMYDSNGNYSGENCRSEFVLVLNLPDLGRLKKTISRRKFEDFVVGSSVTYSFARGRLGLKHREKIELASPSSNSIL
jgi:hypothetical protein